LRTDYMGKWWHERVESGEVELKQVPEKVLKYWLPEKGDKRQELVFIGIDLDESEMRAQLDDCLLAH